VEPVAGFIRLVPFVLAGGLACGQSSPQREFDVVSIKPYLPAGTTSEACNPHGDPVTLTRTGCTLEQLVKLAYDLKPYQVQVKGPAWVDSDRYVIQARLTRPSTQAEMLRMLQPVLAARFHLSSHWENRQAPAYSLQVASHGPKLSPAVNTKQCGAVLAREGILKSDCLTIDDLADTLESFVVKDRPVVNRTALSKDKHYQVNLEFSSSDDPAAALRSSPPFRISLV
jgi:uncharacterized protein (TIGR03435 family)